MQNRKLDETPIPLPNRFAAPSQSSMISTMIDNEGVLSYGKFQINF